MKRIFKYGLEIIKEQIINLPLSPIFISVMVQEDRLVLYALVDDTEKETIPNMIKIVGTGNSFTDFDKCEYLGTVQQHKFVWHIFVKEVK